MELMNIIFIMIVFASIVHVANKILRPTRFKAPKYHSKLPPGNTGWPILGETIDYVSSPGKFVLDRMTKHSDEVFLTSIAGEKMVVFCGPLANKFLFSNENKLVTFWLPPSIANALSITNAGCSSSSHFLVDERIHRYLKLDSMKSYVSTIDTKVRDHLETHWVPFNEVKAHCVAKELTFSLACYLFINSRKPAQVRELAVPFFTLIEGIVSTPLNIPGTPYNRALKATKVIREKIVHILKERRRELMEGGDANLDDFMDQLLIGSQENGKSMDEYEMSGKIVALLFAGFYNLTSTITFLLGDLAKHPHVYDEVLREQREIQQSKREGELLTWQDIQRMKYSWNVVCESMRLTPPGIAGFREAIADFTYAGFTIPKGWKVHWLAQTSNKNPSYFPNPEEFDPSRFEGNKVTPFAFVPFGAGPRMCAGREFARIQTLALLHNVVTRFKLTRVNPDEKIIYKPHPVPAEGLRIRLQPHDK